MIKIQFIWFAVINLFFHFKGNPGTTEPPDNILTPGDVPGYFLSGPVARQPEDRRLEIQAARSPIPLL